MDLYLFTLGLGFAVLLLMALLGLGHYHVVGKTAPAHGHGFKFHKGTRGQANGHESRLGPRATVLALLSPRTFFSFLLGFGATGLLLRPLVPASALLLLALAVGGGWGFETLVMNPLWTFLFRFASTPARTLDTLALEEGRAATDFDAAGNGLITVDLDGQVRQVLGTLTPEERGLHRAARSHRRPAVHPRGGPPAQHLHGVAPELLTARPFSRPGKRPRLSAHGPAAPRSCHNPQPTNPHLPWYDTHHVHRHRRHPAFVLLMVVPALVGAIPAQRGRGHHPHRHLDGRRHAHLPRPGQILRGPAPDQRHDSLSSKAINVDLDITDQTADLGPDGTPQPIKVRILASAIVSPSATRTASPARPPTAISPSPRTSSFPR